MILGSWQDEASCRLRRPGDGLALSCTSMRSRLCVDAQGFVRHQCSSDHPTTEALMATGFSADDVAAMSREAMQAPASETMLQSPHLRRLLSDALSNTWAATQGVQ